MTLKECSFCENKAEFHIPYENLFGEMEYVLPHCKEHNKKANDAFRLCYGTPFIKVGWEK